jgi:predicted CXXCH cytochrome family protein
MRQSSRATAIYHVACTLALLLASSAHAAEPPRFAGTAAATFEYHAEPAMRMPTAVAVGPDGAVYVADGVNDRILVFAPSGEFQQEIREVGGQALSDPISLKVDQSGALWIADTGSGRVLVRSSDGTLAREITISEPPDAHPPDITDVALSPDGQRVWLADNDNHHLVEFDLRSNTSRSLGRSGESLGQYFYPFMVATSATGDVFMSEPVSGRVQVHNAEGQAVGTLGGFGVELGQLYRPKGLAVDSHGKVWVADGVMGVVQVFEITGALIDVLRDPAGEPLKFDMPCGIALDDHDNLYVAELAADRVRKFEIEPHPGTAVRPPLRPTHAAGAAQPRACTVCHLEWLAPFVRGESTALMALPQASPESPIASRPEMCLSCHDGSVVDSRRRVWLEHGHRTGVAPPPGMHVPSFLPLVNGKIVCRTCHSAHASGQPSGDMATAVFLRVPNRASELCVSCHADKAGGRQAGMHPTGGMPWPVPEVLLKAGARVGPNLRELTCQVCHTPHGAPHEHLLVMGTESNQLCLACHDQIRPGMFRAGGRAEHPLSPVVDAAQAAAVREMGTQLGPDHRLICLSCHKLHEAVGPRFLLADELTDGRMCLRCHENKRVVVDSPHDLRQNHPDVRNRLGMTAHSGGPCSACHLFHRYARAPEASEIDPGGGKCITCHQPGRPAEDKVLGDVNHAIIACTKCHDPHTEKYGEFLRDYPHVVCSSCHAEQGDLAGGPHDVTRDASAWPAVASATHDECLACHRPHGNEESGLFRAGYAAGEDRADAVCIACHQAAASDSNSALSLLHSRDATQLKTDPGLPLGGGDDAGSIACRTCHNPHRGALDSALLRVQSGANPQELCFRCHNDVAYIQDIGHGHAGLQAAGLDVDVCGPCHVLHGQRASVEEPLLWPEKLAAPPAASQTARPADRYCVACHRAGGPVAPPAIATHPQVDMFNATAPDAPSFLPLFNDEGEVDPTGTIACRTCHLTHGRDHPAPVPPNLESLTPRELRARQWHIRSFGPESVCVYCHGSDGLRRFMYFHDPARRGGPLQNP